MGKWLNSDGLYIKTGVDEALQHRAGMYETTTPHEIVAEIQILVSELAAVGSNTLLSDSVYMPKNAYITKAEFFVETAFAGATGTLDLGFIRKDRTTELDYDGIDAAIAVASLTAGAVIACDGALIKTRLANAGIPTARNNTADFTAGKGWLRIYFRMD